jgi:hypothetical protein
MTDINRYASNEIGRTQQRDSLVDVLDRVLDKGVVIAGDIVINLLDIELLTIKVRLLIASVDKAREMGINWWETDPQLTHKAQGKRVNQKEMAALEDENRQLRQRLERMDEKLTRLLEQTPPRQNPNKRVVERTAGG